MKASTHLANFAMIVTAEPYFAVKRPNAFLYEARNAVRITRLAGAERYAAEPFHKALQLLQQSESTFAHKKGQDIPDVKEKAREAIEAAEDARAVATNRSQESSPLRPEDRP